MQRYKIFLLAAAIFSMPSYAQSTSEQEVDAANQQQRPEMPSLFFHKEQRRVLEAVRQGVVQEGDFNIEEFVPVVILEEILPEEIEEIITGEEIIARPQRGQDYYLNAYMVNRSNGKAVLWLNGRQVNLEKDSGLLARQGIVATSEEEEFGLKDGVFYANDVYSNSYFKIKVGQAIGIDGGVEERLPVIRINKR